MRASKLILECTIPSAGLVYLELVWRDRLVYPPEAECRAELTSLQNTSPLRGGSETALRMR